MTIIYSDAVFTVKKKKSFEASFLLSIPIHVNRKDFYVTGLQMAHFLYQNKFGATVLVTRHAGEVLLI